MRVDKVKRKLPKVLANSFDFSGLTPRQKKGFEADLEYREEIVKDIDDWFVKCSRKGDLKCFLDNLELDVVALLSFPDADKGISSWRVRSSWTFETTPAMLKQQFTPEIMLAINEAPPTLDAKVEDYNEWLRRQGKYLGEALNQFYSATELAGVIAHLMASDILLANLLVGLIRFRLIPEEAEKGTG